MQFPVIIHGGILEFPNEAHQRLVLDCMASWLRLQVFLN